jgi:glycosyltransferase involved in cell wall biosynthesis
MNRHAFAAIFAAAVLMTAGAVSAQQTLQTPQSAPPPGQIVQQVPLQLQYQTINADEVRNQLQEILRMYPPGVGEVLRYDHSLLERADYLAPYPNLTLFLQQHPEIQRNPQFYFGGYNYYERRRSEPLSPEVEAHWAFVSAAALLVRHSPAAHFVVAGEGELRRSLKDQIERLGLNGRFHLIGEVRDMPAFYRELDVFVMPSISEGFGIAMVEALASGLPCIVSRVGGAPEVLMDGGGILTEPASPESLGAAMQQMLSKDIRGRYASQAVNIARRFSMDSAAGEFARIYSQLLDQSQVAHSRR